MLVNGRCHLYSSTSFWHYRLSYIEEVAKIASSCSSDNTRYRMDSYLKIAQSLLSLLSKYELRFMSKFH